MEFRAQLRPVTEDDLTVVETMLSDATVMGPFNWSGWPDPRQTRRDWDSNGLLSPRHSMLMVVDDEVRLGFVSWHGVEPDSPRYWQIGINLLPEARGQGYGTEAQLLLVRYLFATSALPRVEACTEPENRPEQRSLEKTGFSWEGTRRRASFRNGAWRDEVVYSILRDEVDLPGD